MENILEFLQSVPQVVWEVTIFLVVLVVVLVKFVIPAIRKRSYWKGVQGQLRKDAMATQEQFVFELKKAIRHTQESIDGIEQYADNLSNMIQYPLLNNPDHPSTQRLQERITDYQQQIFEAELDLNSEKIFKKLLSDEQTQRLKAILDFPVTLRREITEYRLDVETLGWGNLSSVDAAYLTAAEQALVMLQDQNRSEADRKRSLYLLYTNMNTLFRQHELDTNREAFIDKLQRVADELFEENMFTQHIEQHTIDEAELERILGSEKIQSMIEDMANAPKRPVERIEPTLDAILQYWKSQPDMRLGQLVSNIASTLDKDIFQMEDTDLLHALQEHENFALPDDQDTTERQ